MESGILEHYKIVQQNILKSFGYNIEKAVAQIGETRQWADGIYKKVENGKWVKVNNDKERSIAASGIIKKITQRREELQQQILKFKQKFEDSFESKFPKESSAHKILLEKVWINEQAKNDFIKKIKTEQKDLLEEINEIKEAVDIDKKKKREIKAGKKELDISDINDNFFFNKIKSMFDKINKEIPIFVNAKQLMPEVTIDDYYLDTETTYRSILNGKEDGKEIVKKWDEMKKDAKYIWHQSPKSSSEYLVDKKTGDIYRFSNHWGKVASCNWDIESKGDQLWDIAKSNIKDFKRKESGNYLNPKYQTKIIQFAEFSLPKLKKLVSENKDFYLTDKAKKSILGFVENIFNKLQKSANVSIEEITKLKKKYDFI